MKPIRIILAVAFALCLLVVVRAAQLTVNIGTTANDGTGDTLRTAFGKVNTNFTELYGYIGSAGLVAHVGTVAEMQALNPTNYRVAIVHGYGARGDGAGIRLFVPTNSIANTNLGTRIVSTNYATWSWESPANGPLNRLWFGGSDSTAYTNAVNAAPTNSLLVLNGLLHLGDGHGTASIDPVVNVNRALSSGSGNAHAFSDSSTVTRSGNIGYNSFDCRITFDGSSAFDHYAGFQYAPIYSSSGLIESLYGLYALPSVSDGMVGNNYGVYIANPAESGSGSVSNNWGIYVATQSAGSANYAAAFMGKVGIGNATPAYALDILGTNPRILVTDSDTNYAMLKVANDSYAAYFGQEGSTGGSILTGSTAGATVITSSGDSAHVQIGSAGVLRMTVSGVDGGINVRTNYIELEERTALPAAPSANAARLYIVDNGAGKSSLRIRFASGAEQTIATEP